MKNFKKVLALVLVVVMAFGTMTTAFAATANDAEAKVLYDLGLFDGKSADEYMPALEDAATAPEALKLIGTALGWVVDADATTTFEDVPAWAVPWVAKAVELGITNGVSDTEFGVDVIDGQRVVTWFLRALGYDMTQAWEETDTLAATAGLTVPTMTMRDDIVGVIYEGLMTTPVGGDSTLIEAIVLGDAALTAIAEDAGLVEATLAIESVTMVGVDAVEVKLNKAVDTATTTVQLKKGAAIYSSSVTWNDALNMATVGSVYEKLPADDYTIVVTTADATLTEAFTVAAEAAAMVEVTATELIDAQGPGAADQAQVSFVVKNQYGEDMGKKADDADLTVSAYNVTQSLPVSVNEPNEAYFRVDTATNVDDFKAGDVVRFTVTYLGMTTQANVTVVDPAESATVQLGGIVLATDDTMLDEGDATVKLTYTLVDQYGNVIDFAADAGGAFPQTFEGVQFISSNDAVITDIAIVDDADGVGEIVLTVGVAGSSVITAVVNETGSVANTSVVVNGASAPDSAVVAAPTALIAGNDANVDLALTVTDQYGSVLTDLDLTKVYADVNSGSASVSDTDGVTLVTFDPASVGATTAITLDVYYDADGGAHDTATDTKIGTVGFEVQEDAAAQEFKSATIPTIFEDSVLDTASYTVVDGDLVVIDQYGRDFTGAITLATSDDTKVDVAGAVITADAVGTSTITITVGGLNKTVDVTVIASSAVESYTIQSIDPVYAGGAAYNVAVALDGVDADGNTVVLASTAPTFITSSDEATAAVANTIEIDGMAAGTATITAYVGATAVDTVTVTVTEEAPVATTVEWVANPAANDAQNLKTLNQVIVKDQYGVNITSTTTLFFAGGTLVGTDGLVTGAGTVTETITVVTANNLSATADVDLN